MYFIEMIVNLQWQHRHQLIYLNHARLPLLLLDDQDR